MKTKRIQLVGDCGEDGEGSTDWSRDSPYTMEAMSKDEEAQMNEGSKSGLKFFRSGKVKSKYFYDLKLRGKVIRYEVRKPFTIASGGRSSGVFAVIAKVDDKQL